jgi:site-specific recombinase XerD
MYLVKRNKFYHVYYRDAEGTMKTYSTKKTSKREAMEVLNQTQSLQPVKKNLDSILFSDFVNKFIEYAKVNFSPSYVEQFQYSFRELKKEMGDKYLTDITFSDIDRMVNKRRALGKNTSTNTFIICLKSSFNRAIEWGYLEANPAKRIKQKKIPKNYPSFITEEEFARLIELENNELAKSAYIIAFYTGVRISELLNIRWEDVDYNAKKISIRNHQHHITKSKKQRDIPIHPKVEEVLNALPKDNEFVLQGYYNRRNLSKRFKEIVKKDDKIDQSLKFHSLRHSFASNLVRKGISLFLVQKLLGHADYSTTQIYSHLRDESLNQAIQALS